MIQPKEIIKRWVELFNQYDAGALANLYHEECTIHQTPVGFIHGKENIRLMFQHEFAQFEMVCIAENIFQDGNTCVLEWRDPKGLRGCSLFWVENNLITYQRGYWDNQSFMNQQENAQSLPHIE